MKKIAIMYRLDGGVWTNQVKIDRETREKMQPIQRCVQMVLFSVRNWVTRGTVKDVTDYPRDVARNTPEMRIISQNKIPVVQVQMR